MAQPGVELSAAFLESGPPSVESRVDEAYALPDLIRIARQAEADGMDAVVIDCMADPGLATLREAVRIPVIGVAQTAMSMATNLAQTFGIVTVLDRIAPLMTDLAALYGYERQFSGCLSIIVPVLDIEENIEVVHLGLAEQSLKLVQDRGAQAIILGCTGFFGCAAVVRKHLLDAGYDIPVIDPLPLATLIAGSVVRHGISHSRIGFPAYDLDKPMTGYAVP